MPNGADTDRGLHSMAAYLGTATVTFIFGPVLTYALLRGEHLGLAAYSDWRARLLGLPPTPSDEVALERLELCMRTHAVSNQVESSNLFCGGPCALKPPCV